MSQEIERKFLVNLPLKTILRKYPRVKHVLIEQRYLSKTGDWTTRIRQTICDGDVEHWLTFKKKITDMSCFEPETVVNAEFYATMAQHCGPALRKIRHEVEHQGHCWEIDFFLDPVFDGLVMAEIELKSEAETFVAPDWLGTEVTQDKQYKNAQLVKRLTTG